VEALRRVDLCPLCAVRTPLAAWGGEPPRPLTPLRAEAQDLFGAMADERLPAGRRTARGEGLRGWLRRLIGRRGA
jgi:hypothetical protein